MSFTSKYAYTADLRNALLIDGCGGNICDIKLRYLKLLARQMCRKDINGLCPEALLTLASNKTKLLDMCFPKLLLRERPGLEKCKDDATLNDETIGKIVNEFGERFQTKITFEKL